MTRIRVFIVLVLAITAGGAFALGTYNYVQNLPTQSTPIPTRPVVVATSDLDIGAELTKDNVKIIQWPANAMPANVIGDPKDVIGRGLILPMIQNEPFLPMKLASAEAGAGLPPAIPPGLRALSIKVNEVIGVAGYVLPGTRVDVLVTVSPGQGGAGDMTSKVILTNVTVLAAGTKIDRETDKNKPIAVSVVTLLVSPAEAERLTLASTEGKIQLALRNPLDKETPVTTGIRQSALLGVAATTPKATPRAVASAPKPVYTAPDAATVEIIRGDKRAREAVRQE
jgi:pilus assembly protein CpaB